MSWCLHVHLPAGMWTAFILIFSLVSEGEREGQGHPKACLLTHLPDALSCLSFLSLCGWWVQAFPSGSNGRRRVVKPLRRFSPHVPPCEDEEETLTD